MAAALAEFLTADPAAQPDDMPRFDLIELSGIDAEDRAVGELARAMADRGNTVHLRPGPNCWRIASTSVGKRWMPLHCAAINAWRALCATGIWTKSR